MEARVDGVDRCDVAVVGGSLAGAAAATALARAGVRVVVLEKARFPRNKVCGCFLSPDALPVLRRMGMEEELRREDPETIARFTLVQSNGSRVDADLPALVLSISRGRLDAMAAAAAESAGAQMRFGTTVLAIEGDLQRGFLLKGHGWEFAARAVVGAWGRYSPLDGRLGRTFIRRRSSLFGFGKTLTGSSDHLANRAALHFFEGGYVGLSRVEGGLVNLAALASRAVVHEAHDDLEGLLGRLSRESAALARDLEGLTAVPGPSLFSEPVYLGSHGALAGDVLCVGDAAGVIDPYTGTGMSLALLFGDSAAAPLAAFLAGTLDAEGLRREHLRRHREIAGQRFFYSRLFRPFFSGGALSRLIHPAAAPFARWAAKVIRGKPLP
jgi:flavin-dependent dehydrogenase